MKKLFLTTTIVIVAIGGALGQDYYLIGSSEPNFYCPSGIITCDARYGYDPIVSKYNYLENPWQPDRNYLSTIPWDGLN